MLDLGYVTLPERFIARTAPDTGIRDVWVPADAALPHTRLSPPHPDAGLLDPGPRGNRDVPHPIGCRCERCDDGGFALRCEAPRTSHTIGWCAAA